MLNKNWKGYIFTVVVATGILILATPNTSSIRCPLVAF
jgi:hypothetical protein